MLCFVCFLSIFCRQNQEYQDRCVCVENDLSCERIVFFHRFVFGIQKKIRSQKRLFFFQFCFPLSFSSYFISFFGWTSSIFELNFVFFCFFLQSHWRRKHQFMFFFSLINFGSNVVRFFFWFQKHPNWQWLLSFYIHKDENYGHFNYDNDRIPWTSNQKKKIGYYHWKTPCFKCDG